MHQVGPTEEQQSEQWQVDPRRLWRDTSTPNRAMMSTPSRPFLVDSLVCRMAQEKVVFSFAGQGFIDLDDLARMYHREASVRETVEVAEACVKQLAQRQEVRWSGIFTHSFELVSWLLEPASRPDNAYLQSPLISQILIFVHQVSRYRMLYIEGLCEVFQAQSVIGLTGHSQGVWPALLIGQSKGGMIQEARFVSTLQNLFWQGLCMATGLVGWRGKQGDRAPMASVTGPSYKRLQEVLSGINAKLDESEHAVVSLRNTHNRHVLSGPTDTLAQIEQTLAAIAAHEGKQKRAGKRGGKNLSYQWEDLDTAGPYHSPAMIDALELMREKTASEGFELCNTDLHYNVYSPATGTPYNEMKGDLRETLMQEQFILPVNWQQTVLAMAAQKPAFWLDLGPGDGVLRLSYANLKGTGVTAISVANKATEDNLFSAHPKLPSTLDYQDFAPQKRQTQTGEFVVENKYTLATQMAPMILPGMTPTTSDAPIVAAAANAGFASELAGGGQVTEAIFWRRMEELRDALTPGSGFVFNSLYMDRYLWDLHCGKTDLISQAKQAGFPLIGVTVSAGIPDVDEAVSLLDKWVAQGIWLNAFKPGTLAQIKQVTKIAAAAPHHTVFVHLEGGKAGGHHSWESLDDLLLDGYHMLREQSNIVLCVGGGVGSTDRAVELLDGTWSRSYDRPIMPVDAVFLGTLAMACLEACTSPQVKQALLDAKGTPNWVPTGKSEGAITSGRSQLNADIHYIDNPAAHCGRLLDSVAGDAAKVAAKRDEIIAALNATARPYFGDLTSMTYQQVAERMCQLMAIGRQGLYEDGPWLDQTHRTRFFDFLQRAEARLTPLQEGTFASLFQDLAQLDQPADCAALLLEHYPQAATTYMHLSDVDHFIHQICARPGKPVNFVPVIDEEVRRWYKADSLWQAHDDRYEADQVLIIPGPEAVAGLTQVDEPVGDLLTRMNQALLDTLTPTLATQHNAKIAPMPLAHDGESEDLEALANLGHEAGDHWGTYVARRQATHQAQPIDLANAKEQLFQPRKANASIPLARANGYAMSTSGRMPSATGLPLNMAFSLAWEPMLALLTQDALIDGLLRLVHLDHAVLPGEGWPLQINETYQIEARLLSIDDSHTGRTLRATASIMSGDVCCAEVKAGFLIRGNYSHGVTKRIAKEAVDTTFTLQNDGEIEYLLEHDWLVLAENTALQAGQTLRWTIELSEQQARRGDSHYTAHGQLLRGKEVLGTIALDGTFASEGHPVRACLAQLHTKTHATKRQDVPTAALARDVCEAPRDMTTFAATSGDHNPIHLHDFAARLAELDGPIVHGMWTAARLHNFIIDKVAGGDADRCVDYKASFVAPLVPGSAMRLEATRVGVEAGGLVVKAIAYAAIGDNWSPVVQAEATVAAPKTAYIFPGQGIQQKGMGMQEYARSPEARAVWEQADAYTKAQLGFSILHIVRENPKELLVKGKAHIHPKGVLHLTQFTQVAMAVLAQAQIEALQSKSALANDAIICGHSVGEYNAIGAMGILPLQDIVEIVYQRGMVMHDLVPRDASGESGYRMGVLRPHYAGMNHKAAEALVKQIGEESGHFLEIVNYNVRNRQYAVTGEVAALDLLQTAVSARATGEKAPYLEVPGIDVPFHSSRLREGVDQFRRTLDQRFPHYIDLGQLCGRYIPNLVPRPFTLDSTFINEIIEVTDSAPLQELRDSRALDNMAPQALGRILLIELLAWQFTSPVRWIETQELLLGPANLGGLGVKRVIEVGVGYQPTLANMARYSHRLMGPTAPSVEILNADAEHAQVCQEHELPALPDWPHQPAELPQAAREEAGPASMVLSAASKNALSAVQAGKQASTPSAATPAETVAQQVEPQGPVASASTLDAPLKPSDALLCLLALQGQVRVDQISQTETLDDLFAGVSSRRNQVLLDIGAEFGTPPIDGAHELPIKALGAALDQRCASYKAPGPYLKARQDDTIKRSLGPVGLSRVAMLDYLSAEFSLGEGLQQAALLAWILNARPGKSSRGEELGTHPEAHATKSAALASVDSAVSSLAAQRGVSLPKQAKAAAGGAAVDAAVVQELEAKILGPKGVLSQSAQQMLDLLQPKTRGPQVDESAQATEDRATLELYAAEYDAKFHEWLVPRFDPQKHVTLNSAWSTHRRDLSELYFHAANGSWDKAQIEAATTRLSRVCHDTDLRKTAAWYAKEAAKIGQDGLAFTMAMLAEGKRIPAPPIAPTRPHVTMSQEGQWTFSEQRPDTTNTQAYRDFVSSLWPTNADAYVEIGQEGVASNALKDQLQRAATGPFDFSGRTALVTGASPNSIALACVKQLLRGGANVVLTTSTYTPERIAFYRDVYEQEASKEAALHIVPFNQASFQDIDALIEWLFGTYSEQDGASVRVLKRPFAPDIVLPFAAIKDLATLDGLSSRSSAVMRAMLLSVERLIAGIGARYIAAGMPAQPMHVVLPLSPNHGAFGGDGVYAEAKAALEVLCNKWHSERDAWAAPISFCAARIGWVRGTGLMDDNNLVAPALEEEHGLRTFSSDEMGLLLSALCTAPLREFAADAPLEADLTGGFATIDDLKQAVTQARQDLEDKARNARTKAQLWAAEKAVTGQQESAETTTNALPNWPLQTAAQPTNVDTADWPSQRALLEDTIVLVGAGELGPCGSARTRFALEVQEDLAPAAVVELAWLTGLITYSAEGKPGWRDAESGDPLEESEIGQRYKEEVRSRVGIRFADPDSLGFNPAALPVMASVFLEKDLSFSVASEPEAQAFVAAAPETTRATFDAETDQWQVTRLAGTEIRVPRQARLERQVVGSVPSGFDFQRFGIGQDMSGQIDRLTLFNLVATVDAFVSSGISPEELMQHIHPARVANTVGSGIGGMQSLHRLYLDHFTGAERQGDQLQETLINVIAAHVVQGYIGSYGAMSHPVAACATAAVSLEEGMDKLRLGKADFVVTGGYDDLGIEGMVGFSDMNATANTDQMAAMGFTPAQMSRGNDARRRGFVEAQGGGTILMTRGDVAADMGLPVLGVLAYTGSFGDGIHKSIPAPGLGAMAAVCGGKSSPLGKALTKHGLSADDIALVYKHDTSTAANDPNENQLHHSIQETLGRTEGNPLYVVSQKSLTGHAKGGAAAWQTIGLCQSLRDGVIPGNRNLDCVDDAMRSFGHMGFTNKSLHPGKAVKMKAGLLTSLGFGHVSGVALVLHPDAFLAMIDEAQKQAYVAKVCARQETAKARWAAILMGKAPAYEKRDHRRLEATDGSQAQVLEESQMLTDPSSRLNPTTGFFATGQV